MAKRGGVGPRPPPPAQLGTRERGPEPRTPGDKLSSARAQSARSRQAPGMEMRTRGLERTAKPQRAAGGRSRFPGALGGDADPTALDQHGARSHSQAERALSV